MRKIFAITLILCIAVNLASCKTQKDIESEIQFTNSNLTSEPESTKPIEDSLALEQSEITDSSNSSTVPEAEENNTPNPEPQVCRHSYSKTVISPTCSANGYTDHICTKCGDKYTDSIIPAGHDFSKYLCERCGFIDPECDIFYGLSAWLSTYGTPNGKGNMNCYPNDSSFLMISNYLDHNTFFIEYYDYANNESFSLYVQGVDFSTVSFYSGSIRGSYDIKNSALSSAQKITFDQLYIPEDEQIDEDVFATECAKKIDNILLRAQNEILYPKTGLKLKNFGFTSYS